MNLKRYAKGFTEHAINDGYQLFLTTNFRMSTSFNSAHRKFVHFFELINLYSRMYSEFIRTYIFYEKNDDRTGVHIHALIKGIDEKYWPELEAICFKELGQTKLKRIDEYTTEYLLKKDVLNRLVTWEPLKIRDKSYQMTAGVKKNRAERIMTR